MKTRTFGSYGYTVQLCKREKGWLHLRWLDPITRRRRTKSLKHRDWKRGELDARTLAAALLEGRITPHPPLTLAAMIARYEKARLPQFSKPWRVECMRRGELWCVFLGGDKLVESIAASDVDAFAVARRAGQIKIPKRELGKAVRTATVWHDVTYRTRRKRAFTDVPHPATKARKCWSEVADEFSSLRVDVG